MIVFLADVVVTLICFFLAIWLRFGFSLKLFQYYNNTAFLFVVTTISYALSYFYFGLYRGMWRFASTKDLENIIKAVAVGTLINLAVIFLLTRLEGVPRTIFLIQPVLLVMSLGGMRFSYRMLRDHILSRHQVSTQVLIIGAGNGGIRLAKDMIQNPEMQARVIGFLDDDPSKQKRTINGISVLGKTDQIPEVCEKYEINQIILAMPSAKKKDYQRILTLALKTNIPVKTLPKLTDILLGKSKAMQLKDIDPEDLLGREAVKLDLLGLAQMINDKIVLVTGAGGSIGSELTRQIAHFKPKALILFELSEFLLHEIEIELKAKFPKLNLISIVGDVKNFNELKNVFTHYRPELILHAAAYKHVPLMERNPRQAVITNILGTQNVARLAREFACARMVMISTDKAVNPTNVMGATKRIAEMIVNSEQEKTNQTIFTTVRFGNVLGSNGSVIPLFKKQIETGGPITVTHPEITRYFMSIPEACQLVLQSAAMSLAGQIFVLDMASPIKIVDLSKQMISMAGYIPEVDIKIEFTGLREGEKLYEELLADEENTEKTAHQSIRIGQRRENPSEFNQFINELIGVDTEMSREQIHFLIKRLVPEFHSHLLDKQDEGAQVH